VSENHRLVLSLSDFLLQAVELILKRTVEIERATYKEFDGLTAAYKSKIRSLFVNLKDKNNPGLRESIVTGDIHAEKLPTMSSAVSLLGHH
jgi:transcription elongation factor S-II